jgi:putative flippase GtrA
MNLFIKTQIALILGSIGDYLTTILLVEVFHCWFVTATISGNIVGAIAQFILSRTWVFHAEKDQLSKQVLKFILIWAGNIALSAESVYLLNHYLGVHYLLAKLIVSVVMGVSYTYLLSKMFVFSNLK